MTLAFPALGIAASLAESGGKATADPIPPLDAKGDVCKTEGEKINVALNISSASFHVLAHEAAHCMGLPDLYTYGGVEGLKNPAVPWDIMSLAGRSTGFLGWHRHRLKWLDADRKAYLTESSPSIELTPLSGEEGISMVVVPVDDPARPSKVFVIEVAQPIRLKGGMKTKEEGVLIYRVDATLATGRNPVMVYPRLGLDIDEDQDGWPLIDE